MKVLELKSFKIHKITIDFDLLSKGPNQVLLETRMGVMIPQDDTEKQSKIIVEAIFRTQAEATVLSIVARGGFDLPKDLETIQEKQKILQDQGAEQVYNKVRNAIDDILKISNVEFMNLPPYEDLVAQE